VVKARAEKLNIEVVHGVTDKKIVLIDCCKKKNYDLKKVLYIGNDLNDLEVMKLVGYPIAPIDAVKEIKKIAKIITRARGGKGVIRELLSACLFKT